MAFGRRSLEVLYRDHWVGAGEFWWQLETVGQTSHSLDNTTLDVAL
ncbi:MAG: hypothetical protein LBE67_00775 [Kocuria palustris]|nr:hypothetical protein [Kocuria palustris]